MWLLLPLHKIMDALLPRWVLLKRVCFADSSCAAYFFGTGVERGDSDACTDGIQLTSQVDTSCNVKCAAGYSQTGGSTVVTCASDASNGDGVTATLTCQGELQ